MSIIFTRAVLHEPMSAFKADADFNMFPGNGGFPPRPEFLGNIKIYIVFVVAETDQ